MSARTLRVVGLDLSLTSTGVSDGDTHRVIQTSPHEQLEARLDRLVRGVVSFALAAPSESSRWPMAATADLAVIEGASYGSKGSGVEQLAALRLMVRHRLWRLGIPFALVAPSTLKLYVTGHGRASKPEMVKALDDRHGTALRTVKVKDGRYDMADAMALAAMGCDHVGQPLPELPDPHRPHPYRASLETVTWPDLVSDDG